MRRFTAKAMASLAVCVGTMTIAPVGHVAAMPTASDSTASTGAPAIPHILVVMLENKGYPGTLGKCSLDPYLCSLASIYASDTAWYAVAHPSLPDYLAVTTGSTQNCTSNSCKGSYTPSLGGQLNTAGIPWVAWEDAMPTACKASDASPYTHHHNPFMYEPDSNCAVNDVPYPGVSSAVSILDGATPPDFVWLGPSNAHNMHQPATAASGDAWLQANLGPILSSSWFTGGNATVVITMDEYEHNNVNGGGQVPMVVVSSNAQGHGNVATLGNHYGLLRTIEEAYGFTTLLGAAAGDPNIIGDLSSLFG